MTGNLAEQGLSVYRRPLFFILLTDNLLRPNEASLGALWRSYVFVPKLLQHSCSNLATVAKLLRICSKLAPKRLNYMPGEQYVRVGQVAEALGLSAYQVRRYCDAGVIKSVVIEGQRLIPLDEFHRVQRDGTGPMPRIIDPQQHRPARRMSGRTRVIRHRSG